MPKFKVVGAMRDTGKDITIEIEAASFRDAERKANDMNMVVANVIPADSPQAPKPSIQSQAGSHQVQFKGPPVNCRLCGGSLKKEKKATREGSGCIIALIGLLLSPFLIGIFILLYGLNLMSKREALWRCKKCDQTYPRKIRWFELG